MAYTVTDGVIELRTSLSDPNPLTFMAKTYTVDFDSLASEDSGRTDDGIMHIQWILSRTRKVNVTMPPMLESEIAPILDFVSGRIYYMRFRDPILGPITREVYTSKTNATLYSGTIHGGIWTDCTFSAIEMGGES